MQFPFEISASEKGQPDEIQALLLDSFRLYQSKEYEIAAVYLNRLRKLLANEYDCRVKYELLFHVESQLKKIWIHHCAQGIIEDSRCKQRFFIEKMDQSEAALLSICNHHRLFVLLENMRDRYGIEYCFQATDNVLGHAIQTVLGELEKNYQAICVVFSQVVLLNEESFLDFALSIEYLAQCLCSLEEVLLLQNDDYGLQKLTALSKSVREIINATFAMFSQKTSDKI